MYDHSLVQHHYTESLLPGNEVGEPRRNLFIFKAQLRKHILPIVSCLGGARENSRECENSENVGFIVECDEFLDTVKRPEEGVQIRINQILMDKPLVHPGIERKILPSPLINLFSEIFHDESIQESQSYCNSE